MRFVIVSLLLLTMAGCGTDKRPTIPDAPKDSLAVWWGQWEGEVLSRLERPGEPVQRFRDDLEFVLDAESGLVIFSFGGRIFEAGLVRLTATELEVVASLEGYPLRLTGRLNVGQLTGTATIEDLSGFSGTWTASKTVSVSY